VAGISAKEAALIAQARAEQQEKSDVLPGARAAAPAVKPSDPAAVEAVAPVAPAPLLDPAERAAALIAAARAETERRRQRQRRLYVWFPVAFICVASLCTLLWMWHRL